MKAFDYSAAFEESNAADALNAMTQAYRFERDLLRRCATAKMSRIVRVLAADEIDVPGFPITRVSYLILEKADGSLRDQVDLSVALDLAWSLRCMHHVATGLQQLYLAQIAHQDVKPSNVLVFTDSGSKIGDLGRAHAGGTYGPNDDEAIPGDITYAAPELLYTGGGMSDPRLRRLAAEMYQFGSLVLYMFTGVGTTASLAVEMHETQHWARTTEPYSAALPVVRDAFDRVVEALARNLPALAYSDLIEAFRELSEPDPALRGDKRARQGTAARYSFERYISRFNLLARRAEFGLTKG